MNSNTQQTQNTGVSECLESNESGEIWTLLRATSRTFALSIEGLPAGLREEIAVAYLLLRVSDYLEDHEALATDQKIRLLELWDATLAEPKSADRFLQLVRDVPHRSDDAEAKVALRARMLLCALESFSVDSARIVTSRVRETTRGMARRQALGPEVADEGELDDYMHDVAGLVGYLVTDLFALHFPSVAPLHPRLMPLAREFGLALQTVNVLRGLRKDFERGWVYVPRSFCDQHNLSTAELFQASCRRRAMGVVAALIEKAEQHLLAGLAYIRMIPRHLHRVRLACMWPLLFAARTIAVSRNNPDVLTGEVKIARSAVKQIIRKTTLFGWSNSWLQGYAARLLSTTNS